MSALCAASGGCIKTTLRAEATEPNPLVAAPEAATHRSHKVFIDIRDMDLPRTFKLRQSAYFNVVSRERLRFHVMLVHKWEEVADVNTWSVRLEDDQGRVFYPESKERAYNDLVVRMWDHENRTAVRNDFGDIRGLRNDGYKQRVTLDSVDVFQSAGDYVFHAKGIFHRGVRRLTLILERSGIEYKFTWNLVDFTVGDEVAQEPPQAATF